MLFSVQNKIAICFPPRTGTTTLYSLLQGFDSFGLKKHSTIKEVKDAGIDLSGYTVYGFIRNPVDRYLSICRYIQQYSGINFISNKTNVSSEKIVGYNLQQIHEFVMQHINTLEVLCAPQTAWLNDAELLDYDNYDMEVLKLARLIGKTQITIPRINGTINKQPATDEIKAFVQMQYADDYALAKDRLGKEYI